MSYGMSAQEDAVLGCRRLVLHISVCTGKIKILSAESPISGHEVKGLLGEGVAHIVSESLRPAFRSLPSVCVPADLWDLRTGPTAAELQVLC